MDYAQAVKRLKNAAKLGSKPGLDNIRLLCTLLGNPQDAVPAVHVAGTNGKGSTCAMLARILKAAGYRTGLYTSPYIADYRDSFDISGENIRREAFAQALAEVGSRADAMAAEGLFPTEFELLTACAFHWFYQSGCDIAVIETGMGGRLDATNVISRPLVSVITAISYDHTAYLGDTLAKIAREKCGIFRPGGVTVCYPTQPEEAMREIRAAAKGCNSELILPDTAQLAVTESGVYGVSFTYRGISARVRMGGAHQALNAVTAIEATFALRQGFAISDAHIAQGLGEAYQPARQEVLCEAPLVLLDGAHNLQGIEALAQTVRGIECRPLAVVMGMLADKQYEESIALMAALCDRFFAVRPDNPRALPAQAAADIAGRHEARAEAYNSMDEAVKAAAAFTGGSGAVVICGSLYMAKAARRAVKRHIPVDIKNRV